MPEVAKKVSKIDVSTPMIYQYRQENKLPPDENATYRQCIHFYLNWYKTKVNVKSSDLYERNMLQSIRNGIVKEQLGWMELQKQRSELVDKNLFFQVLSPVMGLTKSGLVNISRKYPETQAEIDTLLKTLEDAGHKISQEAIQDSLNFVDAMMDKEVELDESE